MVDRVRRRPEKHAYFLAMAQLVATRGTCARRAVGAVIIDDRNHVRATGYNGVAAGAAHCSDSTASCPSARLPSGSGLEGCYAIHAEANALLQVMDTNDLSTLYLTVTPCVGCARLICNTSIKTVVFGEVYIHHEDAFRELRNAGKEILLVEGVEANWGLSPKNYKVTKL